jgi:hypothetical protein
MTDQQDAEALESVKDEGTQPEQNADAGTAQEGNSEEKPQPDYDKIIAEKAFEARKAKREKKELEEKLKSLEAQNAPKEPEVPDIPDRYDFDTDAEYHEAVKKRDQALIEKNRFDFSKEQAEKQKLEASELEQKSKQEEINQKIEVYSSRAKEFKIEPDEMRKIGEILEVYELRSDIVEVVLGDEEGPLIAKYLASNPDKVQSLNSSTWMNGETIYKQVKESASALKPKVTSAPEPAEVLTGGASVGSGDSKYKMW